MLCIGLYGIPSVFLSSFTDTKKPIAKVNFERAKQKSLANVYYNEDKDTVFLILNDEFGKMNEIYFSEFITKYFQF